MKCLLIFDTSNDIIYTKYNTEFALKINEHAQSQGLMSKENGSTKLNCNVIVQLFSPIVTSQRIMSCQFGNSYTSIQCEDNLNFTFEEYMGYLFVNISHEDVASMKRFLNVCIAIIRYLCGPDVMLLKTNKRSCWLVTRLIDSWTNLYNTEQLMLVEAIEQLVVNSELSSAALQALNEAVDKLQVVTERFKVHALILVQNKFLSLYSSRTATTLSSRDILFLILLSNIEDEVYSPSSLGAESSDAQQVDDEKSQTHSYQVLLSGNDFVPKCIPHVVHMHQIVEGVNLVFIIEAGNPLISSGLYDSFFCLHTVQVVQMQQDVETLKPAFDNLDTAIKKLTDGLKRTKGSTRSTIEFSYKQLVKQWEVLRKRYLDFMKSKSSEALLAADNLTVGLIKILKELLSLTAFDHSILYTTQVCLKDVEKLVSEKLENFYEFFKAKALKNFTLGSDSLTINKYLEEFPGLVHFIYIDRTSHRVTMPTLDFSSPETVNFTKKKIWSMLDFSRNHLQDGHLSLMWKDTTFNYAFFLWFEDISGTPLKPAVFPTNSSIVLPMPGIFCGDFYQKLKEACFPKITPSKIKCYELYCIHLGLVTASCVLEHTRRLAATIWELRGHPDHPIDLLISEFVII